MLKQERGKRAAEGDGERKQAVEQALARPCRGNEAAPPRTVSPVPAMRLDVAVLGLSVLPAEVERRRPEEEGPGRVQEQAGNAEGQGDQDMSHPLVSKQVYGGIVRHRFRLRQLRLQNRYAGLKPFGAAALTGGLHGESLFVSH